ncbi:helix-turn-helix domain-containing protein [Providencia sp. JUb39]|uniref:helix-turn-helix domain-containing protein n=1 Tax=Providencia sp. JUb39 TaxID=2724165 RepID=UPI0021032401|nr:helix-turn-helix transcriptional regulator [Providencia sp. JUb39]
MKETDGNTPSPKKGITIYTKAVGYEIYLLRKRRSLSGKDLANLLNISQQQVSRYERGICNITIDMLVQVLNVLKMPIQDFLDRAVIRVSIMKFKLNGVGSKDISLLSSSFIK